MKFSVFSLPILPLAATRMGTMEIGAIAMPSSQKFSRSNFRSKAPDSMPYLKTRLQVLGRPRVWGALSILLIASYGLFQYWGSLSQRLGSGQNAMVNPTQHNPLLGSRSGFSSPDFSSPDWGNLPTSPVLPQPYASPGSTSVSPKAARPTRPNTFNPFGTDSATASQLGSDAPISPNAASGTSANFANPSSMNSEAVLPVSPLQSGLDRNFSPSQGLASPPSMSRASVSVGGNAMGGNAVGGNAMGGNAMGGNAMGGNSTETTLSPVGAAQFQPFVPRTSPPSGSTGYTLPPAFRTPANTGSDASSSNFSRFQPLPGFTSTQPRQSMGSQLLQPQPLPQQPPYQAPQFQPQNEPFSVPRTTPGRSIGSGQINTFSNP